MNNQPDGQGKSLWRRMMDFEPSARTAERNIVIAVVVLVVALFVVYLWSL